MNQPSHFFAATFLLLAFAASANGENIPHDLSKTVPIKLVHGVNSIPDFDGAGHPAQIVYAWRENMNAHGYGIYSVLMLRPGTKHDWNLVNFDTRDNERKGGSEIDSIYDKPFDDESVVASVRFLKTTLDGNPTTLAVTAERDLSAAESFGDGAPVKLSIYRLMANAEGRPGWPYYYFDRVDHFTSDKRYCNSDMALAKELRLPLPKDYQGLRNEDGCIR